MLEGMYAAAAGMYAQQARLDSLSNDIANVNTAGYKPVRMGFRDLLYNQAGLATADGVQLGAGAAVTDLGRVSRQGSLQMTERVLDIAISGPGFFQVQSPTGEQLLTRAGSLQVDVRGRLTTTTGHLLSPQINIPAGTDPDQISIAGNGVVEAGGRRVGQIRLVEVRSPSELRSVGDNAFAATQLSGAPRAATGTSVVTGALEGSAVDLGEAMTQMIEAQRAYQLASRAITTQDQVAQAAIGVKR